MGNDKWATDHFIWAIAYNFIDFKMSLCSYILWCYYWLSNFEPFISKPDVIINKEMTAIRIRLNNGHYASYSHAVCCQMIDCSIIVCADWIASRTVAAVISDCVFFVFTEMSLCVVDEAIQFLFYFLFYCFFYCVSFSYSKLTDDECANLFLVLSTLVRTRTNFVFSVIENVKIIRSTKLWNCEHRTWKLIKRKSEIVSFFLLLLYPKQQINHTILGQYFGFRFRF